jgi:transposase-like protein
MMAIFINIFSRIIKLWLNYDEDLEHCLLTKDSQTSTFCCPKCGSYHTIKNGSTHNGKPKRQCKDCGRQFVINPNNKTDIPHIFIYFYIFLHSPRCFYEKLSL